MSGICKTAGGAVSECVCGERGEYLVDNRELGLVGENAAAEMLRIKGYRILRRNYRCKMGEIDIIASRGANISFVEVKTRRNDSFGRPCEAVDRRKQEHIRRAASCYLKEIEQKGYVPLGISFDVIEIVAEHLESAF